MSRLTDQQRLQVEPSHVVAVVGESRENQNRLGTEIEFVGL